MSTWRVGDSWITFHRGSTGTAGGKLMSKQQAFTRATESVEIDLVLRPDRAQRSSGNRRRNGGNHA